VTETLTTATETDLVPLLALLEGADLPTAGFIDHLATALVARDGGSVIGSVAIELYGEDALLRSLAVAPAVRGQGLGQRLVDAGLALARKRGTRRVWLLTTTAAQFFPRFGFEPVEQSALPSALGASAELRGACPISAVAMMLALCGSDRPPPRLRVSDPKLG